MSTCCRCEDLDLSKIFSRTDIIDEPQGVPVANIKALSRSCRRARCSMCRFLASSTSYMDKATIADDWHLRAFNFETLRSGFSVGSIIPLEQMSLLLLPGSMDELLPEDVWPSASNTIVKVSRNDKHGSVSTAKGRVVDSKAIDYSMLRSWIDDCFEKHGSQCRTSIELSLTDIGCGINVIDCTNNAVIPYVGDDFVALSYCIGPRAKSNRSSRRFPKVVSDAVRCTLGLGYRYLWIDSICIDQNDSTKLADAISKMHYIYSLASVTIVSLGASQYEGLPGISGIPRRQQAVLESKSNTYVSLMSSLPVAINQSKWITRGWCYQEAVLSRRVLIFGPEETYFVCNSLTRCESIETSLDHSSHALSGLRSQGGAHRLSSQGDFNNEDVWAFGAWLSAYTARDLSFQGDALNAFRGLLNVSKHRTYWGVPLVMDKMQTLRTAEAFAIGLSWATCYNQDPEIYQWDQYSVPATEDGFSRADFPSWSWAACRVFRSPIRYKHPGDFHYESEDELYQNNPNRELEIYFEDYDGSSKFIADAFTRLDSMSQVLPERSKYVQIETDTIQVGLCKLKADRDDSPFARYCIRLDKIQAFSKSFLQVPPREPHAEPISELPDGRFLIDFDTPIIRESDHEKQVDEKIFLGLVLFLRADVPENEIFEDDGAYCVLLTEMHNTLEYYERVGLVWIESNHMTSFEKQRQRIRLA